MVDFPPHIFQKKGRGKNLHLKKQSTGHWPTNFVPVFIYGLVKGSHEHLAIGQNKSQNTLFL